uniref:Dihydroxyphenylglycine synthase subunit B n=1 Tax=uncultured soil bacterium TaxID=164851 RepID=E2D2E6_9BACT|nr:dihydroxyphenylglycine synthase subunit B [uncultured soil bacterium]
MVSAVQMLTIDGAEPLTAASVKALEAVCDRVEDSPEPGIVTVRVTGAPGEGWADALSVSLVTKWERVLRRFERLPAATVAVANGDCGGTALDAFLATDARFATWDTRLLVAMHGEAGWPGMATYRLVQQAGAARVRRAVVLGLPIHASEALALGLVDELTADPAEAVAAMEKRLDRLSGKELAIRRQLMFDAASASFEDALGPHLAACDRALRQGTEVAA